MTAGIGVYALSQWLIAVVLARQGGTEAVGIFAFGTALAMPFVVASQLGLRQMLIADVGRRYAFSDYLYLRRGSSIAAFAAIAIAALFLGFRSEALVCLLGVAAGRCAESISDLHYGRLQSAGDLRRIAYYTMLRGLLALLAVTVTFLSTRSTAAAGLAFAAACAVCAFVVDSASVGDDAVMARRRGRWQFRYLRSLLATAAPLTSWNILNNVNANIPRYALMLLGGAALVGQFAVLEHFIAALNMVVMALGQSVAPRLARAFHQPDRRAFETVSFGYLSTTIAFSALLCVAALILGAPFTQWLYGPAFEPAGDAFAEMMVAASLMAAASALGYIVPTTGQYSGLAARQVVVIAITAVFAWWLGSLYGLSGIAIAVSAGYLANIGFLSHRLWRQLLQLRGSGK